MLKMFVICLSVLIFSGSSASAESCPLVLEEPVLITSAGQNLDALIIKATFDDMRLKADFLPMADPSVIEHYGQVVISPGISYKGMVASGTTLHEEIERTKAIIEAAREHSSRIVLMHLGGFTQGDAKSQELIELVAQYADVIIAYRDSRGPIEYFLDIAREREIPFFIIDNLGNLCDELTVIFSPAN